jgi:dihydroflavonol-4-reductase
MKTAYVTGGTGCVGRNLINELLADGWRVIAAHRRSSQVSRLSGLDIELREVNFYDTRSVENSIPPGVEAIFHVAGNTSHWAVESREQWKDNALATRHLVHAALIKHVGRFVFTSTGATLDYGRTTNEEAARIKIPYVRTKRQAELEVRNAIALGLDAVITHPIIVVGAYDYNSYSQIFTALASRRWTPVIPGSLQFCHARDVARGHIGAFAKGRKGEGYMLGGPWASWLEVYQKIARLLNVPPPKKAMPYWTIYSASFVTEWISYFTRRKPFFTSQLARLLRPGQTFTPECECKAKDEFGYHSASVDEMLKDCYDWMVNEKLL